jgi:hypothetical protein
MSALLRTCALIRNLFLYPDFNAKTKRMEKVVRLADSNTEIQKFDLQA